MAVRGAAGKVRRRLVDGKWTEVRAGEGKGRETEKESSGGESNRVKSQRGRKRSEKTDICGKGWGADEQQRDECCVN